MSYVRDRWVLFLLLLKRSEEIFQQIERLRYQKKKKIKTIMNGYKKQFIVFVTKIK